MTALVAVLTHAPGWELLFFALLVVIGAEALPRPRPLARAVIAPVLLIAFASLAGNSAQASEPIVPKGRLS